MKKLSLLLSAGLLATGAMAQSVSGSMVRIEAPTKNTPTIERIKTMPSADRHANNFANKTTAGGERWYNYVELLVALDQTVADNAEFPYMWFKPDIKGIYQGTSGLEADSIRFASYGMTFDPNTINFNDKVQYNGMIGVQSSNAYILDSVAVYGVYGRNPNKPTIVDTLRLSFVYGNGGATNMPIYYFTGQTADFGVDTTRFAAIWHNVVENIALKNPYATTTTPSVIVKDIILDAAAADDTISNGLNAFEVAVGMNIPAGNYVGMTVTFKTGDMYTPNVDTAFVGSLDPTNPFRFGMWRPWMFEQNLNGFPSYSEDDRNQGSVKFLPETPSWDSLYVPAIAYTAPFAYEFPYIDFKVSCATCVTTNEIIPVGVPNVNVIDVVGDAYPNPANTSVNIPFTVKEASNVTVSLSNTVGQVISTQNLGKVNANQAKEVSFSTSFLSSGIYFYTVEANGQRITKRFVVSH